MGAYRRAATIKNKNALAKGKFLPVMLPVLLRQCCLLLAAYCLAPHPHHPHYNYKKYFMEI